MKLDILNMEGTKVGDIDLSEDVFAAKISEHLLWEAVRWQRAKRRAGTHSTKKRDEVRGGGKKPYRQKGTGRARQGSSRAPNHVGGGKVFGPQPRSYVYTINKKAKKAALRAVLSIRAREHRLLIIDSLELERVKTRSVVTMLASLNAERALVIDAAENEKLSLSMGNLVKAKYLAREGLNVYDVLNHETLLMTAAVASQLNQDLRPE